MAVTSVDIDPEMLRQVKTTYGVRTNREAISLALRDVVMRKQQLEAIDAIAQLSLDEHPTKISRGA
jgi:Arc/MetJ family transcription regulator